MSELSPATLVKLEAQTNGYPANATTDERVSYALKELDTLIHALRDELSNGTNPAVQHFAQSLFCQLDCLEVGANTLD